MERAHSERTTSRARETRTVATLRFGAGTFATRRDDLVAAVRTVEALGYDTFLLPDHLFQQLAPIPALAVVAELTDRLRIGTWVLCNDFHHPVIVARELATLDALSGGRLDVGLGAGYIRLEYDNAGITFETGGRRFRRLQDSVAVMKALWQDNPVTLDNDHFHLRDQIGSPPLLQRPHPPLLLGGGGPKMLTWAATEADIVSIIPAAAPKVDFSPQTSPSARCTARSRSSTPQPPTASSGSPSTSACGTWSSPTTAVPPLERGSTPSGPIRTDTGNWTEI